MLSAPEEQCLLDHILPHGGPDVLTADAAVPALEAAGLAPDVLAEIWDLADAGPKGYLERDELAKAIRLIGWAQRGFNVKRAAESIEQQGPLTHLSDYDTRDDDLGSAFLLLPPLNEVNKAKYKTIFDRAGPEKDVLCGFKAWTLMMKSNLPLKTLTRIWYANLPGIVTLAFNILRDLADTRRCGTLPLTDFNIGMYLIHGTLEGHFTSLPPSIPQHLYEQAAGTAPDSNPNSEPEPSAISEGDILANAFTTDFYFIRASANLDSWTLPPIVKRHADTYFAILDSQGRGYVEGEQAVPFMLQSALPSEELERIWDLIDSTSKGQLNADDFALALFLIYKILTGISIPRPLPWNTRMSVAVSRTESPSSEVFKPKLNRRQSQLPSPQERHELLALQEASSSKESEMSQEMDVLRSQLESMTQLRIKEKSALQSHIHELQMSQHELLTENSELRLSIGTASHSMRRSLTLHADKTSSLSVENANLRVRLRQIEDTHSDLKNTHERTLMELTQDNQLLEAKMESLVTHLEARNTDYDVQRLVIEELTAELDRLRAQAQEYRDMANLVPSMSGDEELQRQINEDLANDNRKLRSQVEQLVESLSALQARSAEMVSREEVVEAERVGERMGRRVQEVEGESEELRRQLGEMREENERLRVRRRRRPSAVDDVPPPAYEIVG